MRRSAIDKFESLNEKSSTSLTQVADSSKRRRKHKLVEKQMKKKEKSVKKSKLLNYALYYMFSQLNLHKFGESG